MRRAVTSAILVAIVLLGFCAYGRTRAAPRPATHGPKITALVCTYEPAQQGVGPQVTVVAGPLAGKGWVRSERAGWMLRTGDGLSLYAMETGVIGSLEVIARAAPPQDQNWCGALFSIRETTAPDLRAAYDAAVKRRRTKKPWLRAPYPLAAWDRTGHRPRWIRGDSAKPNDPAYRRVIVSWLARRGVPRDARASMEVEQIVRADLNGDGRREVLLSFHSPSDQLMTPTWPNPITGHRFSYLVLRNPASRGKPPTMRVLAQYGDAFLTVHGFCDLDRDGCAEIVVSREFWENEALELLHWNGRTWRTIKGWSSGL